MRRPPRLLIVAVTATALTVPAVASAMPMGGMGMGMGSGMTATVTLQYSAYDPDAVTVLTGDTVNWQDVSRQHTVTAGDGSWSSPILSYGDRYSVSFTKPGSYDYYCKIHSFMQGTVNVEDLLLSAQTEAVQPNRPFPLTGRSAAAPGTEVTIEGDSGSGFVAVGSATVADDGTFATSITPAATTTYRARIDSTVSPTVLVRVLDRQVSLSDVRRRGRDIFTVTVTPASPGATVVLQYWLRVRFGWWPERQVRVGTNSQARFVTRLSARTPVRAALTLADGATVLALSPAVRAGPGR